RSHGKATQCLTVFICLLLPRTSTLFPYTTLFRSLPLVRHVWSHVWSHDHRQHVWGGWGCVGYREGISDTPPPTPYMLSMVMRPRSEEHTSELQSRGHLVCRLLLENKNHDFRPVLD